MRALLDDEARCYRFAMSLPEIESAVDKLPREDQERLRKFLNDRLRIPAPKAVAAPESKPQWPDFAARVRKIYGDKVMPNMVLAERDESN